MFAWKPKPPAAPPPPAAASPIGPRKPEDLLQYLEWSVLRRLDGLLQGDYRNLVRGTGLDLAGLREYQHNDDVRHIDWNLSARTGTPYVRQFHEDREITAWLLLDLSASIDFGSRRSKQYLAAEFAGSPAQLLSRHGNRIGAIVYGNEVETVIPAGSGRGHVLRILQRLLNRPPPKHDHATRLADLLHTAAACIPRRSQIFVISDFISEPGWEEALGALVIRHECVAVRLFDPLEMALPDLGLVMMQDAETGEQRLVDTSDHAFRARFAALANEREQSLRESFAHAGVDALELSTEEDLAQSLLRFCALRKQRSRLYSGNTTRVRGLS